ncbi:MAG: ATP-binding protein [Deltaproteobacteria bacterium]|nr:MAG: ATP-binding protein [Deltaproteobacteria bacterium]
MLARIATGALDGVDARPVDVEVNLSRGLPAIQVIGLPDGAVREARLRVDSAFRALGLDRPTGRRVTISLAPSHLRKSGSSYDLPMAVGLLAALERLPSGATAGTSFAGELGLDGSLRPIRGALALAQLAREQGQRALVVPFENAAEAALVPDLEVYGARGLDEVVAHLCGAGLLPCAEPPPLEASVDDLPDLRDVRGQTLPRRALEIAAAGGHHLAMIGPPGAGKTLLARRLPGLLPPLSREETVEVTKVYSAAGLLPLRGVVRRRPFRAPHHTASQVALVGGGQRGQVNVGELSLAHRGVLFLDEAAEFPRGVLDALRTPLEAGVAVVARSGCHVTLPTEVQLVLATNPCPCGYDWEGAGRTCVCAAGAAERYLARLSGPLLDRIDLQVAVDPVDATALRRQAPGEPSASVRARVLAARARQQARSRRLNVALTGEALDDACPMTHEVAELLELASRRMGLSARGFDRVRRVARTIADLAGSAGLAREHVLEALSFRALGSPSRWSPAHAPGWRQDRLGAPGGSS